MQEKNCPRTVRRKSKQNKNYLLISISALNLRNSDCNLSLLLRLIGLVGRGFANGPED